MSRHFRTISQLLDEGRPDDWPVAWCNDAMVCWKAFAGMISTHQASLSQQAGGVILSEEDPLEFLARMLAGLRSGQRIIIPPNFRPQTLSELAELPPLPPAPEPTLELYTSGTTGQPKLVSKALRQLEAECRVLEDSWGEQIGQRTVIATTPFHHIYGLLFRLLWPLSAGRPFDCTSIGEPTGLQERLASACDTILVSSPAQLSRLPDLLNLEKLAPRPAMVFSSGGPLQQQHAQAYVDAWDAAPIEIFGSTETGGIAWRSQRAGDDAWTPLPTIQLDQDTDGALTLVSPFLPDATPYRMEDGVAFTEDGRFRLLGRLDRVVKIEEKRLSLPEMEAWLGRHPLVAAAALVPVPLENRQVLGAVVVLREPGPATRRAMNESLRQHLGKRFDPVLLPRKWRYVEHLPFNERGKLSSTDLLAILERAP